MKFSVFMGAHNLGHERTESALYEQMTEQALLADRLGFEGIFLVEHHFNDYNLMTDPFQFAVRIFERTQRIKVGTAVVILPNHHPLQLAGRLAQIDVLYPGRFIMAVGRGSSGYEAARMQTEMDEPTSRAQFLEHVEVMVCGLTSDHDHSHQGRFFQYPNLTILPRPVTKPLPHIWLSAVTPESIYRQVHTCAKLGMPVEVITSPFRNPMSYVAEGYAQFLKGLAEVGVPRDQATFCVNRTVYCGETMDEAMAAMPNVLAIHHGLYRQLENNEVYIDGKTQLIGEIEGRIAADQVVENVPWGDVARVREQVRAYHELGVDMLSCYFDFGLPHETVMASMTRFAEQVMPEFAD